MKKQEIVYRRIACGFIDGERRFTQLGVARELGLPLGTVNGAVRNLESINSVRVSTRSFEVSDLSRLLLYWATKRKLNKDIVYQTRVEEAVKELEAGMPGGIAFTAYSAYRLLYGDAPADYGEVYVYATERSVAEIKRRFAERGGPPNLVVLRPDAVLESEMIGKKLKRSSVCAAQLFVDLWNLRAWYAKDYADGLERRLGI